MGNHVFTQRRGTICPKNFQMDVVNKSIITETILPNVSQTIIMTSSPYPINFTFNAEIQENTTLYLNSTLTKSIQPFAPLIFRFKFDNNTNIVRLIVTSEDSNCMIIAAEVTLCPTLDSNFESGPLNQKMQKQGVLILEKLNYQDQDGELFLVLETQPSEDICKDDATYKALDPWRVGKLDLIYHTPDEDANLTKTVNISLQSVSITQFDWWINAFIGICLPFIAFFINLLLIIFFPIFILCLKCYIQIFNLKIQIILLKMWYVLFVKSLVFVVFLMFWKWLREKAKYKTVQTPLSIQYGIVRYICKNRYIDLYLMSCL